MRETELGERLASRVRERGREERGCLPAETLAGLAVGEIAGAEREAAMRHVEACPDCAFELATASAASDLVAPRATEAAPAAPRFSAPRWAAAASVALAATSLVLALGLARQRSELRAAEGARAALAGELVAREGERAALAARLATSERELAAGRSRPAAPLADVPILDLVPAGADRGGPGERTTVERAAGAVTLLLHPARRAAGAGYRLDIAGADGASLFEPIALAPNADGALTLHLPTADLPAGRLSLRLALERGAVASPPEEFELWIAAR